MQFTRRTAAQLLVATPFSLQAQERIDRHNLVSRHNVVLTAMDPTCPLTVGNGEFAFNADVTGLQTLASHYEAKGVPLCTQSQWGWHAFPNTTGKTASDFQFTQFEVEGRKVPYASSGKGQEPLYNYLRDNPHRLHLGRIALVRQNGNPIAPADIRNVRQQLDLWTGILTSHFLLDNTELHVETCCDPETDCVAWRVNTKGAFAVELSFPYGSAGMSAADWTKPNSHTSKLDGQTIARRLDQDTYLATSNGVKQTGEHTFRLPLEGTVTFTKATPGSKTVAAVFDACRAHWARFWNSGAAVEMPDHPELERRTILSQYLTAIQCAGSLPPQETGLTCNSWNGKFHLEMHWWHAAHFALWNRPALLQRSMAWYQSILPSAIAKAKSQGYQGARWPKMTATDGFDSPSPIGPFLIWQQPHVLHFAEMLFQLQPEALQMYSNLVFATADFMASYAVQHGDEYWLGPPVIPAQENHPPKETWNPTYELEYWHEGLRIAALWRTRLKLPVPQRWVMVQKGLAKLPVRDGVYLAHANCPETFTERNRDHPSMLLALGMMPGSKVDQETMRRTLALVRKTWKWEQTWGWDFGATAMTAVRLGDPAAAFEILLMDTPKNKWLLNGHTPQRANLPCYLPSNGALLAAIAMMAAAGYIRSEGMKRLL